MSQNDGYWINTLQSNNWEEHRRIVLRAAESEPRAFRESRDELNGRRPMDWLLDFRDRAKRHLFAVHADGIAGFATVKVCFGERFSHNAYIDGFFVEPEHRRKGVGELLARECAIVARELGMKNLACEVLSPLDDFIRLLERQGFVCSGTFQNFCKDGDGYRDLHLYVRIID